MKLTTRLMGLLAVVSGGVMAAGSDGQLTLVHDGKPEAAIVLPERPTLAAQWGAHELQWHLRQMTGAELPILPESQAATGPAIKLWVGDTSRARTLGLTADQFKPGEHAFQILADAVVFTGIDLKDYRPLTYDPEHLKLTPFPTQFEARGSADAVYDFLEREVN